MSDPRRRETGTAAVAEAPATVQERYHALQDVHARDNRRLVELRDLALERDLTIAESNEQSALERRRDAREPRLEALRLAVQEADDDRSLEDLVPQWDATVQAKLAAWQEFVDAIGVLRSKLAAVLRIHAEQELLWAEL